MPANRIQVIVLASLLIFSGLMGTNIAFSAKNASTPLDLHAYPLCSMKPRGEGELKDRTSISFDKLPRKLLMAHSLEFFFSSRGTDEFEAYVVQDNSTVKPGEHTNTRLICGRAPRGSKWQKFIDQVPTMIDLRPGKSENSLWQIKFWGRNGMFSTPINDKSNLLTSSMKTGRVHLIGETKFYALSIGQYEMVVSSEKNGVKSQASVVFDAVDSVPHDSDWLGLFR